MLDYSLYAVLVLASLAGVLLNILSLPGNWLMLLLGTGWYFYRGWTGPAFTLLAVLLFLLLLAEVVETAGSLIGARKFGASKMASFAAIVGTFIGAILGTFLNVFFPIPGAGNLVGAIGGAFLAAWIVELLKQRPFGEATKAALGAALGRGVGLVVKISTGLLAWLILVIFTFPH